MYLFCIKEVLLDTLCLLFSLSFMERYVSVHLDSSCLFHYDYVIICQFLY